ncbi:MAG: ribonuclease HII [Puniceicoccales bacterium]|jgi:ribonuclease HII|nr:ribonuclease HII [Puniceicoccales bacterium]
MSRLVQHDRRRLEKHPGLVGVDEAGRGCLAGPVSAAAVWLEPGFFADRRRVRVANTADDSKKLSAEAREVLYAALLEWEKAGLVRMAQATASVLEIDAYNILGATRLAMHRCLQTLADVETSRGAACPFPSAASDSDTPLFRDDASVCPLVLVDGRPLKPFVWRHTALVGGDGRSLAIALASILAKVRRDHLMAELHAQYPQYGFDVHKGYVTAAHIAALREHGPCAEHRPLFLRKIFARNESPDTQIEFRFA